MLRVPRSQSQQSHCCMASTVQATTATSRHTRGRDRSPRKTRGRGNGSANRGPQGASTTLVPTTTTGQGRTTWRDAEQPGLQLSQQEDPEPVVDLEYLQSVIRSEVQQALAAAFPQPQPTSVSGPSPSRDFNPPSATLSAGGTPTSSTLQLGPLLCSETGPGVYMHAIT